MADDDTARIPPYLDAKPPAAAVSPTDVPGLPAVVASDGDNPDDQADVDTTPPTNRAEAAVELTQPVPVIGGNRLRTAANLLRHRGICRADLIDMAGHLDVIGALALAAGFTDADLANVHLAVADELAAPVYDTVNKLPETAHLAATIAQSDTAHGIRPVVTVSWWNDHDARTDEALLALLDQAADSYPAVSV